MDKSVNKKTIWKKIAIAIFTILCILVLLIIYPTYHSHKNNHHKYQTLTLGKFNLERIVEQQDVNYQKSGEYFSHAPKYDLANIINGFKICKSDCNPCEYVTTKMEGKFTSTVKCSTQDGKSHYLGYIRVPPGEHLGIDGYFNKCLGLGVYAGSRNFINEIGPCYDDSYEILKIGSGGKKRLVIKTFPPNGSIRANEKYIGNTSSSHNTISPLYGSLFWNEPFNGKVEISISKEGYETVNYPLEWESYTYTSTVVLKPIRDENDL